MTRERFLTGRWNNVLTLGLGLPTLAFAVVVLSTTVVSARAGFIGFTIIGVLY